MRGHGCCGYRDLSWGQGHIGWGQGNGGWGVMMDLNWDLSLRGGRGGQVGDWCTSSIGRDRWSSQLPVAHSGRTTDSVSRGQKVEHGGLNSLCNLSG